MIPADMLPDSPQCVTSLVFSVRYSINLIFVGGSPRQELQTETGFPALLPDISFISAQAGCYVRQDADDKEGKPILFS